MQQEDPLDPDNLEKWKYFGSEDEVLPAYGDSGSEGEYDIETWREMEDEMGELERPSPRKSDKKSLDDAQVDAIIEIALTQFVYDWHSKKAPELGRKQWRYVLLERSLLVKCLLKVDQTFAEIACSQMMLSVTAYPSMNMLIVE